MSLDPDAIAKARGRVRQKSLSLFTTEYLAFLGRSSNVEGEEADATGAVDPTKPLNEDASVVLALMDVLIESERAFTASKVAKEDSVEATALEEKLKRATIPQLTADIEKLRTDKEQLSSRKRQIEQYRAAVKPIEKLPSRKELEGDLAKELAKTANVQQEIAVIYSKIERARGASLQLLRSIDDTVEVLKKPSSEQGPHDALATEAAQPMDLSA